MTNPPSASTPNRAWDGAKRILVLQGGGALGSYQAGVYEGLSAHGLMPDWVAGISIGAINAALIAGNPPERRVDRLRTFWERVSSIAPPPVPSSNDRERTWTNTLSAASIAAFGAPGFFKPRLLGPMFAKPGTLDAISLYDTSPLRKTLEELVDFDLINHGPARLTVGAVNVKSGNSVVFDTDHLKIGPEHIMASGALPPGFPPVTIEGEAYWDGGLVSNTPLEFVLDEERVEDLLIFQVDLFNARGSMPQTLIEVDEREKDIRFSSRTRMNTATVVRLHQAKVALRHLLEQLPPGTGKTEEIEALRSFAQENAVAVVQLIYRKRPYEGGSKDYEFSRRTMLEHWASGRADVEGGRNLLLPKRREPGVFVIDPGLHD